MAFCCTLNLNLRCSLGSHLVLEVYKLHHRQSRGNKGWVQIMMGMINRVNGDMGMRMAN